MIQRTRIATERITGQSPDEVGEKFRTWAKEQGTKIEMLEQRRAAWNERPYWMEIDYYFISPKFIKLLPFKMKYENDEPLECALWLSGENICEAYDEANGMQFDSVGNCDTSGFYYGTSSDVEPKFCARHFYLHIAAAGYTLTA